MVKRFGLRGAIEPIWLYNDLDEDIPTGGAITISIKRGVLEVGFDDEAHETEARQLVDHYIAALTLRSDTRIRVELNQSWHLEPGGTKAVGISIGGTLKTAGHLRLAKIDVNTGAAIAPANIYDSRSFNNVADIVEKSLRDTPLATAIRYYSEEVVDDDRPLYGIYKALETLGDQLCKGAKERGYAQLGILAGHNKDFVKQVMQTAQTTRHHSTPAKQLLSEDECRRRARMLIEAYAKSI